MVARLSRLALCWLLFCGGSAVAQTLDVVSVSPTANTVTAATGTSISVVFSEAVDPASVDALSFWAFGRWSGTAAGSRVLSPDGLTLTLTPTTPFSAGESVLVILSHDLSAVSGNSLRSAGYSWSFWTAATSGTGLFVESQELSTRAFPGEAVRSYGGFGSDVDNDGFLDLCIVNEDSADVRVFLNDATGNGAFTTFLAPPAAIANQASPNEPSDFNRDGNIDFCVCNGSSASVSILLGNGDGTFAAQQQIAVGQTPRGIAVLDVDGDGDIDIVNTNNAGGGDLSLLLNNGSGVFSAPTFFAGGVNGEWALNAADMNSDGILDLVVGALGGQQVALHSGNGDGTFTLGTTVPNAGGIWMGAVGDVDGDGDVDYCGVDNGGNGVLLRGDGLGALAAPEFHAIDGCGIATDLGDLDGDGDLDWMLSSFCGDFTHFANNGAGVFTFVQEFPAVSNASCAILLDLDNDADLDLALVDEIADVIEIYLQADLPPAGAQFVRGDANGDGSLMLVDGILTLRYLFAGTPANCVQALDFDDDGSAALGDAVALLVHLFSMGAPPPPPWPGCGSDSTEPALLSCAVPGPACP